MATKKRDGWETIHIRTKTKKELQSWKESIEDSRRERGIFPHTVTYDYVVHLMEQAFDPDSDDV